MPGDPTNHISPYSEKLPGIVDPDIDWAFGAGSAFCLVLRDGKKWLPVLMELSKITARDLAGMDFLSGSIWISDLYIEPPAGLEKAAHCTAFVTEEFFRALSTNKRLSTSIVRVTLGPALRPEARARSSRSLSTK